MRLSGREAFLAWFALVAAVLGGTWWWGQPTLKEWRDFSRKRETQERRRRAAQRLLDEQPAVDARLAEVRRQLPRYPPGQDVTAEMLRLLERTAKENGLVLLRQEPVPESTMGQLFKVTINCTWEGELEPLVRFLYALQNQSVILDVRQLSINPKPGQRGQLQGTFALDCTYSREVAGFEPVPPS